MLLVVRTPHGDADVRIEHGSTDALLGDIVQRVIGGATPSVVRVDGRQVPSTTRGSG